MPGVSLQTGQGWMVTHLKFMGAAGEAMSGNAKRYKTERHRVIHILLCGNVFQMCYVMGDTNGTYHVNPCYHIAKFNYNYIVTL